MHTQLKEKKKRFTLLTVRLDVVINAFQLNKELW